MQLILLCCTYNTSLSHLSYFSLLRLRCNEQLGVSYRVQGHIHMQTELQHLICPQHHMCWQIVQKNKR